MPKQIVTLGGGCFWCLDAIYRRQPGVMKVVSGYAGGEKADPTYEQVCTGSTGHAEVIQIEFDDDLTSLDIILDLFFRAHDPTTPNRQGHDIGSQYRSVILYQEGQLEEIKTAIVRAKQTWGERIVTEIKPLDKFYAAKDYHQDFFNKNPTVGYCQVVIAPKLKKLEA
jgi:peptide-methionine (S)-S-oxide reductase